MGSFWWICTVVLAVIGTIFLVVEVFGFFYRKATRPSCPKRNYYVVPIVRGEDLEEQLRYTASHMRWESDSVACILLMDKSLDQASMEICKSFCRQNEGMLLCSTEELGEIVQFFDPLEADPRVKIYEI